MTTSHEPGECPSLATLQALLEGTLSPKESDACEGHLSDCVNCQEHLERLAGGRQTFDNVAAILEDEAKGVQTADTLLIGGLYKQASPKLIEHDWKAVLEPPHATAGPEVIGACGRFDIHEYIASGGMGIVFKGYDSASARTVAIKVLAPAWASNELSRKRFLREARAIAALSHEHILPIFSVEDEGTYPFIVMPFVDGETLEQRVQRCGPLPFDEIRKLCSAITKGLGAAHDVGIIHRDLKPANILLQGDHQILLADFGLARAKDMPELTIPGTIPGTPEFMAPEQIDGAHIDHRSDLFALGCLLQFMATGKPPFQGDRVSQVLQNVTTKAAAKITRPQPSWFRHLLGKLLQKDPHLRPADASAVLSDLDRERLPFSSHLPNRRTCTLLLGGIILILSFAYFTNRVPRDTPVYIEGDSTRHESLASAIAAAPPGATLILRDGLHEVPGELMVHQPLRFVAEKGSRPFLRSRDTERGKVFDFKAEAELEGLTLHHTLTVPSKTAPLINTSKQLTLKHCRLEQRWNEPGSPSPIPSAILTTGSLHLSHTVIEAASSCAIFSRLQGSSPNEATIQLEECAIVATRGFFLTSPDTPKSWNITLSHSNLLTGGLFCLSENTQSVPHWKLDNNVIEAASVLMVRGQWQTYQTNILPNSTWDGRDNLYSTYQFLYPWEGGPKASLQKTIEGWLELCPGAQEQRPNQLDQPIYVETLPKDYRGMRSLLKQMVPVTAMDLAIGADLRHRFPQVGGSMETVGPLPISAR